MVGIPVGIANSAVETIKTIIKKMKKKHDKIVLWAKTNSIEVLVSKALIDSCISNNEFVSVNNVLREYDDMKAEIQSVNTSTVNQRFYFIYKKSYNIVWSVEKKEEKKKTDLKNLKVVNTKKEE